MASPVSVPLLDHFAALSDPRQHAKVLYPLPEIRLLVSSATISGQDRVVEELIVSFTHDREMRVYLPGAVPTGRTVVLPHVVVMGIDNARLVAYAHIYWDQATLLVQVGLLDPALLPASGAEQARRLTDPTQPANTMIDRSRLRPT